VQRVKVEMGLVGRLETVPMHLRDSDYRCGTNATTRYFASSIIPNTRDLGFDHAGLPMLFASSMSKARKAQGHSKAGGASTTLSIHRGFLNRQKCGTSEYFQYFAIDWL